MKTIFVICLFTDIVIQPAPAISYRTIGGVLDFFFFVGPDPADVISQYLSVIGRPFLIPQYALGFQLSRYGYYHTEVVNETLRRNLEAGVPVEVFYEVLVKLKTTKYVILHRFNGLILTICKTT